MQDPVFEFKSEVSKTDSKAVALKRKKIVGFIVPVFLGICTVAGVIYLMEAEANNAVFTDVPVEHKSPLGERDQIAAIANVVEKDEQEAARKAQGSASSVAEATQDEHLPAFHKGCMVAAVSECVGFAEEADLGIFRRMLALGETEKARLFYAQLRKARKCGKIAKGEEMTVSDNAWSGAVQVDNGTESWWVAPDWLGVPSYDDDKTTETGDED